MSKAARILVVDDEPAILEVFSELLRSEGYEVWEASTGQQSLDITRAKRPDLVLLDVKLPDLSGIEVCRQIKADASLLDVFVVLFSGGAVQTPDKVGGLEAGADEYIVKSVAPGEVLARIRTMVRLQQSAASLRASEARKNAIMEAALDAIITFDHEGRIVDFNAAAERTFGFTRASILGKDMALAIALKPRLAGGKLGLAPQAARRADGTEFPVELTVRRIAVPGPPMYTAFIRDISERKRTERQSAALSQLGYRLGAANQPAEAASIILEVAGELVKWDTASVHLYSETEGKLTPVLVLVLETVEGQRKVVPTERLRSGAQPITREILEAGAELTHVPIEASPEGEPMQAGDSQTASAMRVPIHASGGVLGVLFLESHALDAYSQPDLRLIQTLADLCGDTLQRIEMAEALRQTEANYRSIVENATDGIFQSTPEGRIRSANLALARMLGYPTPEVLITEIIHLDRQAYVLPERREEFRRLIEAQGAVRGFEAEQYRRDGTKIWVSLTAHVVRDATGKVLYYEGINQDITERKLAQIRLADALELNLTILSSASVGILTYRASGQCIFANAAAARTLGASPERLLQQNFRQLASWQRDGLLQMAEETLRTRKVQSAEVFSVSSFGKEVWLDCHMASFVSGGELHLLVMHNEITERKWAESLLQIQRDFSIFLSSTNDLTQMAERLLKIALLNDGVECGSVHLADPRTGALVLAASGNLSTGFVKRAAQFQVNSDEASPGISWPESGLLSKLGQEFRQEGLRAMEFIPIRYGARVIALLCLGSRVLEEIPAKSCDAVRAIATPAGDAIARIQAEQSLRDNRQLLEKTLHNLGAAVFIIDADTNAIQEANPAASHLFGYEREEFVGQNTVFLHQHEVAHKQFASSVQAAVKNHGLLVDLEFPMRRKDGTLFSAEHSVMPIRNEKGRLLNWVRVVRDITERKQHEQELRQLSQRIIEAQEAERLRVARELHDGVNQILASAKMRLRKVQDNATGLGPAAKEILVRCDGLLVQALEENRRIAHNLHPSVLDELGLATACRNLCKELRLRTSLTVECSIAGLSQRLAPAVELNLFRIVQEALANLEKHACAKTARLRLALHKNRITLRIRDDGCGFDPTVSRAASGRGPGIGLTNMRERAAALGGTIDVRSAPKHGTTITVRVPCPKIKSTKA